MESLLFSPFVNVPAVAMRTIVMFASSAPDETMPSKEANWEVQQLARAGLGAMVSVRSPFTTPVGCATKNNVDLFRVGLNDRDVFWVPGQTKEMQSRLMVCAHMKDAEHRRIGLGDFVAATRILLPVSHGGSRDWFRQAMSTLHGLKGA